MDMGDEAPLWAQVRMLRIIELYPLVFSKNGEVGLTNLIQCDINLKNPDMEPIKTKYRRLPAAHRVAAKQLIEHYKELGVIQDSKSTWRNALVFVKKSDN